MNDAETNVTSLKGAANRAMKLQFELPLFNIQAIFGSFTDQGLARARTNFVQVKATSEEVTAALCDACSNNARRAADYGSKIVEISNANTSAALEFLSQLADARSIADLMNLSTAHGRKTLESVSAQNRELWDLARKATSETAEPITRSFNRVLHRAA